MEPIRHFISKPKAKGSKLKGAKRVVFLLDGEDCYFETQCFYGLNAMGLQSSHYYHTPSITFATVFVEHLFVY